MRISATFGHGEGVVNAIGINTDTILLMRSLKNPGSLYILENNQSKPIRLAPQINEDNKVQLFKIDNPPEIMCKPSLDNEVLTRLFYLGVAVEKTYNNIPVDMELVVKNGIIYPVQLRPINRPLLEPTFLDLRKIPEEFMIESQKLSTFLPGRGKMETITSPEEVLIADNLETAEKLFRKDQHKLVIIPNEESVNSHPVVNFSGLGIPVLQHSETAMVRSFFNKANIKIPVLICVQSENCARVSVDKKNPIDYSSPGFTTHPANVSISILAESMQAIPEGSYENKIPQDVKNLLMQVTAKTTKESALNALKMLKRKARHLDIKAEKLKEIGGEQLERGIEKLKLAYTSALSELKAVVKTDDNQRLKLLLHGKIVESLFIQESKPHSLGRLSFLNIDPQLKVIEDIVAYRKQFNFEPQLSEHVLDTISLYDEASKKSWINFLKSIDDLRYQENISDGDIKQFKEMLSLLREMNLMPLWLSRFFVKNKDMEPTLLLNMMLKEYSEETKKIIISISELQKNKNVIEGNIENFKNPALFEDMWEQLKELVKNSTFLDQVVGSEASSPLGRIICCQMAESIVNLFDNSIKQMKSSLNYSEDEKIVKFRDMLNEYYSLMIQWACRAENLFKFYSESPLYTILSQLDDILKSFKSSSGQLAPSPGFDVSGAILGTSTFFDRHKPQTMEDFFTLMHQNLLASVSVLMKKELSNEIHLPNQLKNIVDIANSKIKKAQIISYVFSNDKVVVQLNIPIRNHSASLTVKFDNKTKKCDLTASLLGLNERSGIISRWDQLKHAITLFQKAEIITSDHTVKFSSSLFSYSVPVRTEEEALVEIKLFSKLLKASFSTENYIGNLVTYGTKNIFEAIEEEQGFALASTLCYTGFEKTFIEFVLSYLNKEFSKDQDIKSMSSLLFNYLVFTTIAHTKEYLEVWYMFFSNNREQLEQKVSAYLWRDSGKLISLYLHEMKTNSPYDHEEQEKINTFVCERLIKSEIIPSYKNVDYDLMDFIIGGSTDLIEVVPVNESNQIFAFNHNQILASETPESFSLNPLLKELIIPFLEHVVTTSEQREALSLKLSDSILKTFKNCPAISKKNMADCILKSESLSQHLLQTHKEKIQLICSDQLT